MLSLGLTSISIKLPKDSETPKVQVRTESHMIIRWSIRKTNSLLATIKLFFQLSKLKKINKITIKLAQKYNKIKFLYYTCHPT
jgi:hypothetical protein